MSSYRGGAWDGGPPGAEADYAGHHAPAPPALPATDPWTGVSYSQYPPHAYDYQNYAGYGYNYDSNYYARQGGSYYNQNSTTASSSYPPAPSGYEYPSQPREHSRSPGDLRSHDRRRRSSSRSVSPRDRAYSKKRDSSYEEGRRGRSGSRSKPKRIKYSSSDRSSSRSRSYSRPRTTKKRRSMSSGSSASDQSYKKTGKKSRAGDSMTSSYKRRRTRSRSHRTPSPGNTPSPKRSPKIKIEKGTSKSKDLKSHYNKDIKIKREVTTPPPKKVRSIDRSSVTPPKSYKRERSVTPPKSYISANKKHRDSSVTPPRSYARGHSFSTSKSRSRTPSPRSKRKRSPKLRHTTSRSSSRSSLRSRSNSRRRSRRKTKSRSHSKGRSRRRSHSKSRSKSRRSQSKGKKRSVTRSKSRSKSRSSRSRSGSGSEDERRGQFTVADRKRFWKVHRSRLEEKQQRERTPPKEIVPPPGAIENTKAEDIEYGVPPEVEGPNFAELLPTGKSAAEYALLAAASTSKAKNIPIPIKNDGSFLEMFKKLQEQTKKIEEVEKKPEIKKPLPFIGKRRGGRVLKTGMVKKAKAIDEQVPDSAPKDAWSLYMQEVKKYRETSCEEERKTRPLVK